MTTLVSGYASKSSGMKAAVGKSHTAYKITEFKGLLRQKTSHT